MVILLFVTGLVFLIVGAEALVRGASRIAAVLGISPLIIGLTVVSFGTSAPELAVGIKAAISSHADIVLGNVVGSNIFNVLFILGLSGMIAPLVVSRQLIRLDVPLMIIISMIVLVLGLDGKYGRADGTLLFLGLVTYVGFLIRQSKRENLEEKNTYANTFETAKNTPLAWLKNIGLILGGLVLLIIGSRWLVQSAESIARYMGVNELVIGLTVVAVGTSLPELVTSVIASIRGERDIAVGNVIGSNLFNMMGVLGLSSIVAPGGVGVASALIRFDLPVMIVVSFACLPIFFTGGIISRREGILLLGYYVVYSVYLLLAASHHAALPLFSATMLYFAIPLTVATLSILAVRAMRGRSAGTP